MQPDFEEPRRWKQREEAMGRASTALFGGFVVLLILAAILTALRIIGGTVLLLPLFLLLGRYTWKSLVDPQFRLLNALDRQNESARIVATSRPYILVLRSFKDDDIRFPQSSRRFVEVLQSAMRDHGGVVAVTDPDVGPIATGPLPLTVQQSTRWKEAVEHSLRGAVHLLVVVGAGGGLEWEMERIVALDLLYRCIFVVPPVAPDAMKQRWVAFSAWAERLGMILPQEFVSSDVIAVQFGTDKIARRDRRAGEKEPLQTRYLRTIHEMATDKPFDFDSIDSSQNWILWVVILFVFGTTALILLCIALFT